jgi:hypothetical protein
MVALRTPAEMRSNDMTMKFAIGTERSIQHVLSLLAPRFSGSGESSASAAAYRNSNNA